jgi:hypothetical protein
MDLSSSHLATSQGHKEKFELERNTLSPDLAAGLPDGYGDNRLIMMARDPFWFFCYWEFTEERLAPLRQSAGPTVWESSALVLRVFDVTERADQPLDTCPFFDVEVHDKWARQWYVKVPRSGRAYQIELGLRLQDGRFYSFLTSNRIRMPFGHVSDQTDSKFMAVKAGVVPDEWGAFQDISNLTAVGKGSAEFTKTMAQRWEFLRSVFSGSGSWAAPAGWPATTDPTESSATPPPQDGKS